MSDCACGCGEIAQRGRRWIHGHNRRQQRPLTERYTLTPRGCWEWLGSRTDKGYGKLQVGNRTRLAHRFVYETIRGPISNGLQLDHLCRNRACVNPDHLEPVTCKENLNRGIHRNAVKTHCPQGHPYDEANTGHAKSGGRYCRACTRERMRRKAVTA